MSDNQGFATAMAITFVIIYIITNFVGIQNFYFKDKKQLRIIKLLTKPGTSGIGIVAHIVETLTPFALVPQIYVKATSRKFSLENLSDFSKFEGTPDSLDEADFQVVSKVTILGMQIYHLVLQSKLDKVVVPVHFSNDNEPKLFYLRTLRPALEFYGRKILSDIKVKANRKIY